MINLASVDFGCECAWNNGITDVLLKRSRYKLYTVLYEFLVS
jgi:hypothetical protein